MTAPDDAAGRELRIHCHQLGPVLGDVDANLDACVEAVAASVADQADLVVLPELATCGYVFTDAAEAAAAAIGRDHPFWDRLARAAGDAILVVGFAEQAGDTVYNSAAVLDGDGMVAVYRKVHLWGHEQRLFTPGDQPPPVVQTSWGNLGVLVCYDLEFPEMPRALGLAGCDVIAVPTNWPVVARPPEEHPAEVVAAMAAARASSVYIACCDRTRTERGQAWTEGTALVGTDGWLLASADSSGRLSAQVDLALARDKRLGEYNDVLGDRRPELYREPVRYDLLRRSSAFRR